MSWPRVSLADISESIDYGHTASADTNAVGPKFLRITDIQDGRVDWSSVPRCICSESGASKYALQDGDIVFARTGATTGKSYLLSQIPEEAVFASYLIRVRPCQGNVDPGYLSQFFDTQDYWAQINRSSSGTAQGGVNASKLKMLSIPLPPLSEQRRIAAILDKADALRAKRRETIAKLDQLLKSVFLEMFGGTTVATTSVAELAPSVGSIRTGPFGSQLLHSEFVDHGIAVLGIDNAVTNAFAWAKPRFITTEKYSQLSRYRVNPGDVLITIMGTCGRCAVVPDDIPTAINTKHLCCISLDRTRCEPEFLHSYFLLHPVARNYLESRAKGAIMAGLNMGIIKELPVVLPSLEKQRHFVSIKRALGRQIEQTQAQENRFDELFAGLQQNAFAGTL